MEKNNLRKIIKELLTEILDDPKIPNDIEIEDDGRLVIYKFKTDKNIYSTVFKKYSSFTSIGMTKDEDVNNIIQNSENFFYLSWGIFDESNKESPIDDINTNYNEELYVFNSIFGIILDFLKRNPDGIFYSATRKRGNIYKKMLTKLNIGYSTFDGIMNNFLVRNELLNSND